MKMRGNNVGSAPIPEKYRALTRLYLARLFLSLSLLCVLVGAFTLWGAGDCFLGKLVIGMSHAQVSIGVYDDSQGLALRVRLLTQFATDLSALHWWPTAFAGHRAKIVFVPLWIPALVFGCAGGVLLKHNRPYEGLCLHCGYNLRGLTSKRCPECGAPFLADRGE